MRKPSIPYDWRSHPSHSPSARPTTGGAPAPPSADSGLTGIPFMDRFLGDIPLAGQVCGILGPDNSMYNVLLAQVAAGMAEQFERTGQEKAVYYFAFLGVDMVKDRLTRAADTIWQARLAPSGIPAKDPVVRQEAPPFLEGNLTLVDFSEPWNGGIGLGANPLVWSVREWLEESGLRTGRPVGAVVLDNSLAGCERYLRSTGKPEGWELARMLNCFTTECQNVIADHFQCPVWVEHLLAGRVWQKPPTAPQHHSDAFYARKYAEGLTYAFTLGVQDPDSDCSLLTCTKSGRCLSEARPVIVRTDGAAGILTEATESHVLDHASQRIVGTGRFGVLDIDPVMADKLSASNSRKAP